MRLKNRNFAKIEENSKKNEKKNGLFLFLYFQKNPY